MNNESPAALLPERWRRHAARKEQCGLVEEAALDRAHADELERALAYAAPAASESRGSVPDGVTHNERVLCEAIVRHQFQDAHRDGRLTIDVETLLHEYNEHKVAATTPPAVSNGEPPEIRKVAKRNLRTMIEMGSSDKALMLACLEELS